MIGVLEARAFQLLSVPQRTQQLHLSQCVHGVAARLGGDDGAGRKQRTVGDF